LRRALLKEKKENKSPSFPLFLRGKKIFSPLWKRGAREDFILLNPPSPPFSKGDNKTSNFPSLEKRG